MPNMSMFQSNQTEQPSLPSGDLRQSLDLAGHLLSDTAHDLRSPLASARELVQFIADGFEGPVSKRQREQLEAVVSRCNDMHRLIDDMLQFEGARSGTPKILRRWLAPSALPAAVVPLVDSQLKDRKIKLRWLGFEPNLPLVYGDADKLKRLLVNLIANAVQVTVHGGAIDVGTEISRTGDRLRLAVRDNGPGMTAEQIESVAQRGISQQGGQGLGLAICRQIAAMHYTRVGISSEIGVGSRFSIELPAGGPNAVIDTFARWRESAIATGNSELKPTDSKTRPKRRGELAQCTANTLPPDATLPQFPHAVIMLSTCARDLTSDDASASMDRFLQSHCLMHELIYQVESDQWVMLWDSSIGQAQSRIEQIDKMRRNYTEETVAMNSLQWYGPVSLAVGSVADRNRLREAFVRGSLGISGRNPPNPSIAEDETPILSDVAQKRLDAEVRWITKKFQQRQATLRQQAATIRPSV